MHMSGVLVFMNTGISCQIPFCNVL